MKLIRSEGLRPEPTAYVIKPDLDGLLGSIKQFVSRAESAAIQIILADRELNNTLPLTYEIARAAYVG
jgi:O-succinylbenzoate synthase